MQETQDSLLFCQTPLALRPELPNLFLFSTLARLFPLGSLPHQPGTSLLHQCWGAAAVLLSDFREPPITLPFPLIATGFQDSSCILYSSFFMLSFPNPPPCTSSERNEEPGAQALHPPWTSPFSPRSFQPHLPISDVQRFPTTLSLHGQLAQETGSSSHGTWAAGECRWAFLLGQPNALPRAPGTPVAMRATCSSLFGKPPAGIIKGLKRVAQGNAGQLGGGSLSHSSPAKSSAGQGAYWFPWQGDRANNFGNTDKQKTLTTRNPSISSDLNDIRYTSSEKQMLSFLQSIPLKLMKKVILLWKQSCGEITALPHTEAGNPGSRPFLLHSFFMQQSVQAGEDRQLPIFPINREFAFSCHHGSCGDQGQGKAYLPRHIVSTEEISLLLLLFYF